MHDDHSVTAGNDTLFRQAPSTAEMYLDAAIEAIDKRFGNGYAKSNPELVGAFIQCASADFHTGIQARTLEQSLKGIGHGLDNIANALRASE